jgi:hypothetical protein
LWVDRPRGRAYAKGKTTRALASEFGSGVAGAFEAHDLLLMEGATNDRHTL